MTPKEQYIDSLTELEKPFGQFVMELVAASKPKKVLEIGTGWGIFSGAILSGSPDSQITTVDKIPFENLKEFNMRMALFGDGKKTIEAITGPSQEVLPRLAKEKRMFDLIYIDGDHGYEAVLEDLLHAWPMLLNGGTLLMDDVMHAHNFDGDYGVTRALWDFMRREDIKAHLLPYVHGTVMIHNV